VTVDPHLHRYHYLSEVYRIPTRVVPAAPAIAAWISAHVTRPMLVGPDAESAQWVAQVAAGAGCPYTVLSKVRSGDREVAVSAADAAALHGYTPVLVDDIISTARTMMAAVRQLQAAGLPPPVCIGVHALFAGDAYEALQAAGPARIVTCDTVPHQQRHRPGRGPGRCCPRPLADGRRAQPLAGHCRAHGARTDDRAAAGGLRHLSGAGRTA
jgi:ribose-phosphate pyrophosphokinase